MQLPAARRVRHLISCVASAAAASEVARLENIVPQPQQHHLVEAFWLGDSQKRISPLKTWCSTKKHEKCSREGRSAPPCHMALEDLLKRRICVRESVTARRASNPMVVDRDLRLAPPDLHYLGCVATATSAKASMAWCGTSWMRWKATSSNVRSREIPAAASSQKWGKYW